MFSVVLVTGADVLRVLPPLSQILCLDVAPNVDDPECRIGQPLEKPLGADEGTGKYRIGHISLLQIAAIRAIRAALSIFIQLTEVGRLTIILRQDRRGSGSVVEHLLAKEKVAGSNPVFRSNVTRALARVFSCIRIETRGMLSVEVLPARAWRNGRRRGLKNR